jgi:hypothetical protein
MKFSASARLLQFGTNPPVVVLEYEGKTYYHFTQDPAQPDAQKDTPVKARKQRQVTINEARNLLKKPEKLCELKRLIRNAIMNEFWTRTMRRPTHFPGYKPLMLSQPTMLISVNHITTDDNTKNKFATLSSEVPAPHSGQIQQQFQQLQAQMRQLEQQLHGHESTTCTGGRPIRCSPEHLSHTSERYTPAGGRSMYPSRGHSSHEAESSRQGSARYHNPRYHPQYNQRTLAPPRGSPPQLYNDIRRPLIPHRFNAQANREW